MVIKYGIVYACVVGAFAALIVLRAYPYHVVLSTPDAFRSYPIPRHDQVQMQSVRTDLNGPLHLF